DAAFVRVCERVRDLNSVPDHRVSRKSTCRDGFGQRLAVDELHRDIRLAVDVPGLIDRADVWVAQSGSSPRFFNNPRAIAGTDAGVPLDALDGEGALHFLVVRAVDNPHAAGAEPGQDAEMAER